MKFVTFANKRQTFSVKAEKQSEMTKSKENGKKASRIEIGVEMMTGAAAAMLYSDEEIRSVFSKEDADEFIELRRQARMNFAPPKYETEGDDEELSMAAEDEMGY